MATEEEIDEMLELVLEKLDEDESVFTEFEQEFLANVEEINQEGHLTRVGVGGGKSQVEVLEEIYAKHNG